MSIPQIKLATEIYEKAKKSGDWQKELESLSALKLLYSREGDRQKDVRRIVAIWKKRLEEVTEKHRKVMSAQQYQVYRKDYVSCLKYEAEYLFESFLVYMELNRKPKDRFYQPRKKVFDKFGVVQSLQDVADGKLDVLGISMPPRIGKLVADYEPVLTKNGWKTHGELRVGDFVIGGSGKFVKVTHVFPKDVAQYRVKFTDGSTVDVHGNHEWVTDSHGKRLGSICETNEMMKHMDSGESGKRGHRYVYQLPFKPVMAGESKELPVHPYVLGAWLGDGTNKKPCITGQKLDYVIIEEVNRLGYPLMSTSIHKTTRCHTVNFDLLRKQLQEIGMCNSRQTLPKCIPDQYLTASLEQRLDLLAGLIDTDGTLTRKEHRYHITTTGEELKDGIISLVSTFGWRVNITRKEPCVSSSGIVGRKPCWTIAFNPTFEIPCRVDRKKLTVFSVPRRVSFESITPIDSVQGNCISVEGGTYLVGRRLTLTHNSTIGLLFNTFMIGKNPNKSVFCSGHSTALMGSFYDGVNEFTTSDQYNYQNIFPLSQRVDTDAKQLFLDYGEPSRYKSISFRSIDSSMSGLIEATNLLYVDDLIAGIEEAQKPERLLNAYSKYETDIKQRRKDGVPILMIGTRWSLNDPIGVESRDNADNPRAKFIVIPALDENGESNFVFDYGVGFNTQYYLDRKRTLDMIDPAIFLSVYQQQPIESEGVCFNESEIAKYNGTLPDEEPCGVYAFCDVAFGGGDSLSMPIGVVYPDKNDKTVFIQDWVFTRAGKKISIPLVVAAIIGNKVRHVKFEANNGGQDYAEAVEAELRRIGYSCEVTWEKATTAMAKKDKILYYASDIKTYFRFLFESLRPQPYRMAVMELTSWLVTGKSPHDDAPDSLAGLSEMVLGKRTGYFSVVDRSKFGL